MHNRLIGVIIFGILLTHTVTHSFAQTAVYEPLINNNENVLLSFVIKNSTDILTIATAKDNSYIVYRFGKQDSIELEYPEDKSDSWDKFVYSNYSRTIGNIGDENLKLNLNYLEFSLNDSTYRVYDSYSDEVSTAFVGVTVTDRSNGDNFSSIDLQAIQNSKIGSLSNLQKNRKIRTQSAFALGETLTEEVLEETAEETVNEVAQEENQPSLDAQETTIETNEGSQEEADTLAEVVEVVEEIVEAPVETLEVDLELVAGLEQDLNSTLNDSQTLLQGVQSSFNKLIDDTLDPDTGVSYWTTDNENTLFNVRRQVRDIEELHDRAVQKLSRLPTATSSESQQQIIEELSESVVTIRDSYTTLEQLEATALTSFEASQQRFLNRISLEEAAAEAAEARENAPRELDSSVLNLGQEMSDIVDNSQGVLRRVQQGLTQLQRDTFNNVTGISYWTIEDENALASVQRQVRDISQTYTVARQNLAQAQTAQTREEQLQYINELSANYEVIKALSRNLPALENFATNSFEESRNKYITRSAQAARNSQTTSNEVNNANDNNEKSFKLLLGQCFVEVYEERDCERRKDLFYSIDYGVGEQNDGTIIAFVIGPFPESQINDIQTELLTVYGIGSARVP